MPHHGSVPSRDPAPWRSETSGAPLAFRPPLRPQTMTSRTALSAAYHPQRDRPRAGASLPTYLKKLIDRHASYIHQPTEELHSAVQRIIKQASSYIHAGAEVLTKQNQRRCGRFARHFYSTQANAFLGVGVSKATGQQLEVVIRLSPGACEKKDTPWRKTKS